METKKSIGIWIRVSSEMQLQGESPEHHEKRARYYAEAKNWDVQEVYHLEAVSGKSVMYHPEAKRMMQDIKTGKITGIIFSKLARLARNTKELLEFADFFREHNADLVSLQEAIDTSTPAGRLFYTMIAAMAQWEREEIAERVAASVPIRAKLGKPLGGQASFGYKWEGKELIIDEKEAPVRKLIYDLFLKSKRKKTTASELNNMGYRTRNGSKFSDTTIDRLLRDSSAKGIRLSNYTKTKSRSGSWVLKSEEEWVRNPCPKIVSEEIWDECNRILEAQTEKRTTKGPRPVRLLAGFIYCEYCGKKMYVFHEGKNQNYACKGCKIRIPESDLDSIYHEQLKTFLLTDKDVSEYLKQSDSLISNHQELMILNEKELDKIRKEMEDLVRMRLANELSPESFIQHHRPKEERLKQIKDELPNIQSTLDFLRIQRASSDAVLEEAKDLYQRWPNLSFEEKRGIIEVITEKITVGKEDIAISLAYLPSSLNSGNSQRDFKDS